jgi:hypothetical protein
VNWTIVVTTAITGAVGVIGTFSGFFTSSRSAKRNTIAEANRARLAEKRRIYARAMGALVSAAALAKQDAQDAQADAEAWRAASEAVAELRLIADKQATVDLAKDALDRISDPKRTEELLTALRADLGKEEDRAFKSR